MVGSNTLARRITGLYVPLGLFVVVTLFPFYWMLITSLKPSQELYNARVFPLVVYNPTLEHYVGLLTQTRFLTWTFNTLLVATGLVFGSPTVLTTRNPDWQSLARRKKPPKTGLLM